MGVPGASPRGEAAGLAGPAATAGPLTLGTAGHIDHGKTALVRALTGVDTDRLPEEHARGISIALGYAPLTLDSGRRLSLVDVPGHERFVRTMVAGATGIDLYLMVVAADDGVMPQTVEHARVLAALGVTRGVAAITKADLADPARAAAEARALLPGADAVLPCSTPTGVGVPELAAALDRLAGELATRAAAPGAALLHIDRAFTVSGIGAVITGTLWSGALAVGDRLELLPLGRVVRIRSLQVHDEPVTSAAAGQRVAVALAGVRARELGRGDVLAAPGRVRSTSVVDCDLELAPDARHNERVQLHHGTRDVPARLARLGETLWQLRLEAPVFAADGDRVVVRRLSPPDTLGGGRIIDAAAHKHGRRPEVMARLAARVAGEPEPEPQPESESASETFKSPSYERKDEGLPDGAAVDGAAVDAARVDATTTALAEAGLALLNADQLDPAALATLRADGRAVRVSGRLYADGEVAAAARDRIVELIETRGPVSLAEVRDVLGTGRKSAQALLEYLDRERVTHRLPDDRRVLRTRSATRSSS